DGMHWTAQNCKNGLASNCRKSWFLFDPTGRILQQEKQASEPRSGLEWGVHWAPGCGLNPYISYIFCLHSIFSASRFGLPIGLRRAVPPYMGQGLPTRRSKVPCPGDRGGLL